MRSSGLKVGAEEVVHQNGSEQRRGQSLVGVENLLDDGGAGLQDLRRHRSQQRSGCVLDGDSISRRVLGRVPGNLDRKLARGITPSDKTEPNDRPCGCANRAVNRHVGVERRCNTERRIAGAGDENLPDRGEQGLVGARDAGFNRIGIWNRSRLRRQIGSEEARRRVDGRAIGPLRLRWLGYSSSANT